MKTIRFGAMIAALVASASSLAFIPAPGIWNFANENVGQPGRGMMIEVQNEVLFLSYFGYRADGSSVKYYAAGPMANNSFSGDMLDFRGGPVIAGAIQPAVNNGSVGAVSISFTSGTHGTITLPGDSPRPIYKNSFGYAAGPDGLLGTWVFFETLGTVSFAHYEPLTLNIGTSTSTGNGIIATPDRSFGCEYNVSGTFAGSVVCARNTTTTDGYFVKMAGDRATGINLYNVSAYPAEAIRIATRTGAKTGLNDGTQASELIFSDPRQTISAKQALRVTATSRTPEEDRDAAAFETWRYEAMAIINAQ